MATGELHFRARLIVSGQFGPEGPGFGTEGIVVGSSWDEDEKWSFVLFKGYPGYFCVTDDMIEEF